MSEKNISKLLAEEIIFGALTDLIKSAGTVHKKAMSEMLEWVLEAKCDITSVERDYKGDIKHSAIAKLAGDYLQGKPFDSNVLETFRSSAERRSVTFDYLSDKTIKHLYTVLTRGLVIEAEKLVDIESLMKNMAEYLREKGSPFDNFFDSFLGGVFFTVFLGIIFNLILQLYLSNDEIVLKVFKIALKIVAIPILILIPYNLLFRK